MYIKTTLNGKPKFYQLGNIALGATGVASIDLIDPENPGMLNVITLPTEMVEDGLTRDEVLAWLVSEDGPHTDSTYLSDSSYTLDAAKAAKLATVKTKRDMEQAAGAVTPFGPVDTDPASQIKITGAVVMALILGADFAIKWRMSDNSLVDLTSQGMIQLGMIVGQTVARYQTIKNIFDDRIADAESLEELELIDPEVSWSTLDPTTM